MVKEFLGHDPEFAQLIYEDTLEDPLKAQIGDLPREHALQTIQRTRALVWRRSWLLALALFFTALPFSFVFADGRFTFVLWRDAPLVADVSWLAAGWAWGFWFLVTRGLRRSGLLARQHTTKAEKPDAGQRHGRAGGVIPQIGWAPAANAGQTLAKMTMS